MVFNIAETDLSSLLNILSKTRNLCAHDERLYNYEFPSYTSINDTIYHSQLNLPKLNETPILFEDFPASVLEKTEQGKEILGDLLRNGYHKLLGNDFDVYLSGFKLKERKKHK